MTQQDWQSERRSITGDGTGAPCLCAQESGGRCDWKFTRSEWPIYGLDIDISEDHKLATINVSAEIEGFENQSLPAQAKFTVSLGDTAISSSKAEVGPDGKTTAQLKVPEPELWWPNGYGKQPLYTVSVAVSLGEATLHTESRRVGLRKVELVQEPDRHGKSFYFRINDVDVFCGGSCWIPTDSILTNVTTEKYRAWIELMVPANQKMIR